MPLQQGVIKLRFRREIPNASRERGVGMGEEPRHRGRIRGPEPNPDTSPENVRLDLRITAELRRRIRHAAADAEIGLGAWVKQAMEEKLERQERGSNDK
jgi:hypothetical protein